MATSGRVPPHDIEAEQSVLGSILLSEQAMNLVGSQLRAQHFYRVNHADIYQAMSKLSGDGKPVDIITVGDALESMHSPTDASMLERCGGRAYLAQVEQAVPTAANVQHYADIVIEKWRRRRAIEAAGDLATLAYDESVETGAVMDQMQEVLFGVAMGNLRSDFRSVEDLGRSAVERMYAGTLPGIRTGFGQLDAMTNGGLKAEQLVIVAARPGVGKTSLGLNFGLNAAGLGLPVSIFSLEMSADQLTDRLISQLAEVPTKKFGRPDRLNDQEVHRINQAVDRLRDLPMWIDDDPALDELSLLSKGRRAKQKYDTQLIIVDYLQLMAGKGSNREQEVTHISHSLKRLARELKVPVVAMAQLNRDSEKRAEKRPMLADLRESGSIENDADLVILIYREDYHDQEAPVGEAELIVAKHRSGPTGPIKVGWRPELTQFVNRHAEEFSATEAFA